MLRVLLLISHHSPASSLGFFLLSIPHFTMVLLHPWLLPLLSRKPILILRQSSLSPGLTPNSDVKPSVDQVVTPRPVKSLTCKTFSEGILWTQW